MEADLWYTKYRQKIHKKKLSEIKNKGKRIDNFEPKAFRLKDLIQKGHQKKRSLIQKKIEKSNQKIIKRLACIIMKPSQDTTPLQHTRNLNSGTGKTGLKIKSMTNSKKPSIVSAKSADKLPSLKKSFPDASKVFPMVAPIQLFKMPKSGSEDLFSSYFSSSSSESYIRIVSPSGRSSSLLNS